MRIDITRRDLVANDATPRGYRMAWYDYSRQVAVCYPIGVHVVAWAIRRLWSATFYPLPEGEAQRLRDQVAIYEQQRISHFDAMHNLRDELIAAERDVRDLKLMIRILRPLAESITLTAADHSPARSPADRTNTSAR